MKEIQIIENIAPSVEEVAMRLYQISMKLSSDYTEEQINNSVSLRKLLSSRIISEAKVEFSDIEHRLIEEAAKLLARY